MNLTPGQSHEAYIGPPSEPVELTTFLESAIQMQEGSNERRPLPVFPPSAAALPEEAKESWKSLSEDERDRIEAECRVDDLRTMLDNTIQNPRLMGHVVRTHEASVHAIYDSAEPSRKKRRRTTVTDPEGEPPEVTALRLKHEAIKLKCWPLTRHAASFIRPPRQSDHDSLISVKAVTEPSTSDAGTYDCLLFVTVYNRVSWGQKILSRSSQHVLLSSQTLGDLYQAIPCTSNELPEEILDEAGSIVGYDTRPSRNDMGVHNANGAVICVGDVLYGDSRSEDDYAEKVLRSSLSLPASQRRSLMKGPPMYHTKLSTLTIRLHEPYWILHVGNCEHFFAIHSIRLRHPSDPQTGYPLTTQLTPSLSDFCRVCTKVPAVYSVVGDIRMGESPFLICAPCWRWMGVPKDDSGVIVVPLSKYELGWATNT